MDRVKLKRGGQVLAPSLFTMGNMACGFYCLLASNIGDFNAAALAVMGGIAFDMLDGRVARMVHGESSFGVEFDSLSDFLTFGVAPAYMMFCFSLKDYGLLGAACAFIFALSGALRLARFNAVAQAGTGSKTHFQGLPIPAAAGFVASCVLLYEILEQQSPAHTFGVLMNQVPLLMYLSPAVMLGLSFLMVSSVPYGAFKQAKPFQRRNLPLLALVACVLALIYFYPQNAVFLLFLAYVVSGLTGLVWRRGRPPAASGPPAAEPPHG